MRHAILAIVLLASVNTTAQATISRPVTFEQCLLVIEKSASDLDAKPINIVETTDIRIVEFSADDGSVAIICNRLNQEMVITSSPYQ
jgi:hypothetical protein